MGSLNFLGYLKPSEWSKHSSSLGIVAPLVGGVIAPFSVLLDIPALSEKWYSSNGKPAPDPAASLILSGISLSFGIIANALLIARFSTQGYKLRITWWIPLSVACWTVKVIVGVVNLTLFGALTRNTAAYSFLEGFWCAVVSLVTSAIVLALLLFHFFTEYRHRQLKGPQSERDIHRQVRVSGRHFMLSTTLFIAWIALMALVFSRIERWSYLDAIYFSVVTIETVGFGDFEPTHAASRVLLFPFALIGIAFLGTLIQMIVNFFSDRSAARKEKSRALYERERQEVEDQDQDPANLQKEIKFLDEINQRQDVKDQAAEFTMSLSGFVAFWLVGGAIFMALEGWTFGTSMYFCYVLFFTVGYGDYAPSSPAGKVVFLVYSLLAVPIMASFALQAITQVFTRVSEWRLNSRREEQGLVPQSPDEPVITHAEYLARHHRRYDEMFPRSGTRNSAADSDETVHERALREHGDSEERDGGRADRVLSPNGATHGHQSTAQRDQAVVETVQDANQRLVREMLERAIALEAHARRMLIRHLPNGGRAQVVLKADRNVQLRDLRFLQRREQGAHQGKAPAHTGDGAHTGETQDTEVARHGRAVDTANDTEKDPGELRRELDVDDGDEDWVSEPLDEEATLREVRAYRDNFAALLVAGTRLKQLEGDEMYLLERRRPTQSE